MPPRRHLLPALAVLALLAALVLAQTTPLTSAPPTPAAASPRRAAVQPASDVPAARGSAPPFEFVALGDMPYGADIVSGPAYRHLIELINRERPDFSVHVGDFKDGLTECSGALYERQHAYFERFDSALVYTPGDNDWIDCQRQGADPLERLQALRERFFALPRSLGRAPIALERQSDAMPAFARYRENLRWSHRGVLFATFHSVGANNNADVEAPTVQAEFGAREAANVAWIASTFARARASAARAVVLATQGDPLEEVDSRLPLAIRDGFNASVRDTLLPLAARAGIPVLLVHGDSHHFIADQPFTDGRGQPIANLWRLEVPGEPRMHAVKVRVDPAAVPPFTFTPIWNRLSADPRQ